MTMTMWMTTVEASQHTITRGPSTSISLPAVFVSSSDSSPVNLPTSPSDGLLLQHDHNSEPARGSITEAAGGQTGILSSGVNREKSPFANASASRFASRLDHSAEALYPPFLEYAASSIRTALAGYLVVISLLRAAPFPSVVRRIWNDPGRAAVSPGFFPVIHLQSDQHRKSLKRRDNEC